MKLSFVTGTAAELIKLYPLIELASRKNRHWSILTTGQSSENFWRQVDDFQIPKDKVIVLNKKSLDLKNSGMALSWFLRSLFKSKRKIKECLSSAKLEFDNQADLWIVHGDTLSTLLGAIYGWRLNAKIVHIEAGMRTHNILSPFPEEIIRFLVSHLSNYHAVPDVQAKDNLEKEGIRKNVILTHGNTVIDSLTLALNKKNDFNFKKPYVVANIHRFENLQSKENWNLIIKTILSVAKKYKVIFIMMPATESFLNQDVQLKSQFISAGIELKKRMPFSEFICLLNGAEFVLSDGGTNQQECDFLGKPCLIMRKVTECIEGIGGCCVLSELDQIKIDQFLTDPKSVARSITVKENRPTDLIFEGLSI